MGNNVIPEERLEEDAIYVVGHKNPDTDSIASAISYAYFKNLVDRKNRYQGVRLGEPNPETRFVLSYFGLELPPLIRHVYRRVRDAMVRDIVSAPHTATVYEVGALMVSHRVRDVPLLDGEGRLVGLVTERKIARNFLQEFREFTLADHPPRVSDIVKTMDARLLVGRMDAFVTGRPMIGAMSPEKMLQFLREGDVLITGDREDAQETSIEAGISCLIITGDVEPSERVLRMAEEKGVVVIVTPHTTYVAGRLLRLSTPAIRMVEANPLTTDADTVLKDFTSDLMSDRSGIAIVVDDDRKVLGVITRHDLINPPRRRIILVDHSERAQAVEGVDEAEILEIIDHHRLGGLETGNPVTAYVRPVGCTNTLIWEQYKSHNVRPSHAVGGAMLAAILSDTMLLKSPTTTMDDRLAVEEIGRFLEMDPMDFGIEMYNAKMSVDHLTAREILTTDVKISSFPKARVAVAQLEVASPDVVLSRKEEVLEEMERMCQERGYDLFLLMVTDVLKESTEMLAACHVKLAETAFRTKFVGNVAHMPGVMSRKKQVMPFLANFLR